MEDEMTFCTKCNTFHEYDSKCEVHYVKCLACNKFHFTNEKCKNDINTTNKD